MLQDYAFYFLFFVVDIIIVVVSATLSGPAIPQENYLPHPLPTITIEGARPRIPFDKNAELGISSCFLCSSKSSSFPLAISLPQLLVLLVLPYNVFSFTPCCCSLVSTLPSHSASIVARN